MTDQLPWLADPAYYASDGLREQTAELATYGLSLNKNPLQGRPSLPLGLDIFQGQNSPTVSHDDSIDSRPVVEEAPLESNAAPYDPSPASSALTEMIRQPDPGPQDDGKPGTENEQFPPLPTIQDEPEPQGSERTSLLPKTRSKSPRGYGAVQDVESQGGLSIRNQYPFFEGLRRVAQYGRTLSNPKSWDRRAIWREGVIYPISLVPAVLLGLLLNILDALSYGMILFPLGEPLFADLGSDGISMFYVSTIIAQVVFSCGGSIFKGGIGSEMIEVVPFFHQMAYAIMNRIGKDNPQSVLATTILAFSVSSILTGLVFFLMGVCGLGSLIGFFPRHILIGCIGGVGYFLLQTGVEVSARLPGTLEYKLKTLEILFHVDTIALWTIPLSLALGLLVLKHFVRSNFLVGLYFIAVAVLFYVVVLSIGVPMETLHDKGWAFDAPSSNNPWYHFYTLYDFSAVDWTAFADTLPAMFALTFFGILHVPINVPALGISTGEDNLNVDRELVAHGVTNALSGFAGSIQVCYTQCQTRISADRHRTILCIQTACCSLLVVEHLVLRVSCWLLPLLASW